MSENAIEKRGFTTQELRDAKSFDDLYNLINDRFGGIWDAAEEIGDGFELLDDKSRLVGVPLVLVQWSFTGSDYGEGEFVSVRCATQNPRTGEMEKWVINDGSTGIYRQLKEFSESHNVYGGLTIGNGLRRSDYTYVDEADGKSKPATTYYIDTSRSSR